MKTAKIYSMISLLTLALLSAAFTGPIPAEAGPQAPRAGFEYDYQSWVTNAGMHLEKGQHANALLCLFKARRLKPGREIDEMIEKTKNELNKPSANAVLQPIPLSDERIVAPVRNSAYSRSKSKGKRIQFFKKNYGFLIFPPETMNLRDGDYFDYIGETASGDVKEEKTDAVSSQATLIHERKAKKEEDLDEEETGGEQSATAKAPDVIKEYFVDIQSDEEASFEGQTILRRGKKHGKMIALTFDDGPHPTYTPKLLKILKANDAKATFFMLGSRINEFPKVAAKVHADGHEIANHSYSHPFLTRTKQEKIDKELSRTEEAIKKITKFREVWFFRPPYGALPKYVIKKAEDEGFHIIMWSLDSKDYQGHSVDYMLDKILKRVKSGDVMLFHDIHSNTVKLMAELIPILKKAGFKFVSLNEIYELNYEEQKPEKSPAEDKTQEVNLIAGQKSTQEINIGRKSKTPEEKTILKK
ncbi:MAG: Peptidoglycan-N-acetylglucosamine deacetylase [bacterium ADurb.Bin243]|nr:MAG: Peptidoglycan-N-acetylglucosamine deacetylase [bacterium ADurb.Bin243]